MSAGLLIRDVHADECTALGRLLVDVYSTLVDFPLPAEQPDYYRMLANIGVLTAKPGVRVLVAVTEDGRLGGGVVYFGDMTAYGSGGTAPSVRDASGIRLLAVSPEHRGRGVGRALTQACIDIARAARRAEVILHTTEAMLIAWRLYETLGFVRSEDLDFRQLGLAVFGFRLRLKRQDSSSDRIPLVAEKL